MRRAIRYSVSICCNASDSERAVLAAARADRGSRYDDHCVGNRSACARFDNGSADCPCLLRVGAQEPSVGRDDVELDAQPRDGRRSREDAALHARITAAKSRSCVTSKRPERSVRRSDRDTWNRSSGMIARLRGETL